MTTLHEHLTSRIPPQALQEERAVLGALLLDGVAIWPRLGTLAPSDFFKDGHRQIFGAILDLGGAGQAVDLITVSRQLRNMAKLDEVGGEAALAALAVEGATA